VGRIERTLFTLKWLSDPALRQRSHAGVNKGEASNSLRRALFFHRQGEFRDRTLENQSFRASGLTIVTAAIVHWNTVYLRSRRSAFAHARRQHRGQPSRPCCAPRLGAYRPDRRLRLVHRRRARSIQAAARCSPPVPIRGRLARNFEQIVRHPQLCLIDFRPDGGAS
jgi:Tn3 transposase DDE domain